MLVQKLAVVVALSLSLCAAQTATVPAPEAAKAAEPELIGVIYLLDSTTQTLKRLPKEEYKRHNNIGWSTVTPVVKISGLSSSFRISVHDKPTFIIKASEDQAEKVKLFKFAIKGEDREYEIGKSKHRDFEPNEGTPVDLTKFGESSYKLTPSVPLDPGEYALAMTDRVFTFGIDASGK